MKTALAYLAASSNRLQKKNSTELDLKLSAKNFRRTLSWYYLLKIGRTQILFRYSVLLKKSTKWCQALWWWIRGIQEKKSISQKHINSLRVIRYLRIRRTEEVKGLKETAKCHLITSDSHDRSMFLSWGWSTSLEFFLTQFLTCIVYHYHYQA